MYCAKCGKEMDDNAKYCPACGADVNADAAAPEPAPYVGSSSYAPDASQSSGVGVGAMVCGIIGLILCWVPIVGLILSIVAVVLGSKGRKELPPDKRGMATAGFVMGIIGLVIAVIVLIGWVIAMVAFGAVTSSILGAIY